MSTITNRYRDLLAKYLPWWLSDRSRSGPGVNVGYRLLWVMVATLDAYADVMVQGLLAAWPGQGTPTALALIGRSRGITRGQADTDAAFADKLRRWLDYWTAAGTQRAIAIAIHEYLGNKPRVRVVNRAGWWVTVAETTGVVSTTQAAWDWDSVSNPERAGYWSELWIIVYPTQWIDRGGYGPGAPLGPGAGYKWGALDTLGFGPLLGHRASHVEHDAVIGLISQWKSAHSKVRAVIWTSNSTRFDPAVSGSKPNGNWGQWSKGGSGSRVPSDRIVTDCRYWEPQSI